MDQFLSLEKEIESIMSKSPEKTDPLHSKSTLEWVLKLKPDADEALQIAALAHDIERGFMSETDALAKEKIEDYDDKKKEHSEKSAGIICDMLVKHGFDNYSRKKVRNLVLLHEVGGSKDADTLRDADSISFFEVNLREYFKKYGEKMTKFKIAYMYNRMSEKTKAIARKFNYGDPLLDTLFREIIS